jgi:precorrin-3B synthase
MASGDGLLVRLRLYGGVLDRTAARAIADLASRHGNGLIDLSARANLQIRGVSDAALAPLQDALAALGLIDEDPEIEAIRNVMVSPLAGDDPSAHLDIRPLLAALDRRLRTDRALRALPGKFGFLIDDGGALPLPQDSADIAFVAESADRFAVCLGGHRAVLCAAEDVAHVAAWLAASFLRLRDGDRRMKSLVARIGVGALLAESGLPPAPAPDRPRPPARPLVYRAFGPLACIGAGIPFGRLTAADLVTLADLAERAEGDLRLTPWRAILVVGRTVVPALLDGSGFITSEEDPLRAVAACPGHPACASGASDARADALLLAPAARRVGAGITLHVSACPKGCAMATAAAVTLVATGNGYDVIFDGRAGDPPDLHEVAIADLPALFDQRPLSPTSRPDRSKTSTVS